MKTEQESADTVDVRRVAKLCESVSDAFRNYTDGSGHDAKLLAAEVPKLLAAYAQIDALKRAKPQDEREVRCVVCGGPGTVITPLSAYCTKCDRQAHG